MCRMLDKLELGEVRHALDLFEATKRKPDDDYLYAQTYQTVDGARALAQLRLDVCGERNVRERCK